MLPKGTFALGKLSDHGFVCTRLGQELAARIGVPYLEDYASERRMGYRLISNPGASLLEGHRYKYKGSVSEVWPTDPTTNAAAPMREVEILTEEVWSRDRWPNVVDDVPGAIARLPDGKVSGIYYHGPSMTLVLLHPGGLKIGIKASSILPLDVDKTAAAAFAKLKRI